MKGLEQGGGGGGEKALEGQVEVEGGVKVEERRRKRGTSRESWRCCVPGKGQGVELLL